MPAAPGEIQDHRVLLVHRAPLAAGDGGGDRAVPSPEPTGGGPEEGRRGHLTLHIARGGRRGARVTTRVHSCHIGTPRAGPRRSSETPDLVGLPRYGRPSPTT